MRQFFLSLVVAMMAITTGKAQNTLVAVLSHDNNVQTFYGPSALINAVEASVSGDVITLSGGTFKCEGLRKGITIRGNGAEGDNPTIIDKGSFSYFYVNVPSEDTNPFTMECVKIAYGVSLYVSSSNPEVNLVKCIVENKMTVNSSPANKRFINCRFERGLTLTGSSTIKLFNCFIDSYTNEKNSSSKAEFFNCFLSGNNWSLYRNTFVNCLLNHWESYSSGSLSADNTLMNCLLVKMGGGTQVDCYTATAEEVFGGQYPELSEEAKEKYIGTDGTEIGLFGGQYPYDFTPTYPQITKLNVARQSTADNKLSVEIEVSATE